ncbi:hypothetical protein BDV93DRAFT_286204 [Ceratobasidium sp. AG-I]|nr:hypothetical protein BDV93DRAFT_286204 [Ceratobasidium sp. AG-I]
MVQVNSLQAKSIAAVYKPPQLPDHLFNIFNLKPVVGIPTDEEVKLIHSAMRAAENTPHLPALFNPALSTDLANHLFEVQMARYKSKYHFPIFSVGFLLWSLTCNSLGIDNTTGHHVHAARTTTAYEDLAGARHHCSVRRPNQVGTSCVSVRGRNGQRPFHV